MQVRLHIRFTSFMLVLAMLFSLVACSNSSSDSQTTTPLLPPTFSDPNESIVTEDIWTEDIVTEETLVEFITNEVYIKELTEGEAKITELLLAEDMINEVIFCKTIYVPQDHIEDFAEHSQVEQLFGEGIDFKSLATKVAIGAGLIITLAVLSKVGVSSPVATSVIAAASKESLKFGATGAAIGALYGGLTGTADAIDETQRTSSVIAFATATAGLIISVISFIVALPSGGASIGVAAGIKIGIAAISGLASLGGTVASGYNCIKTFQATDATDIDWDNIDWEKVGVSAAEQAINNAGDGFMWGSIAGAVYGGTEGYEFYEKYHAPYSRYKAEAGSGIDARNTRIGQTPAENSSIGKWTGTRGESNFVLNEPLVLKDGTVIKQVTYKNGIPDFSPYQKYKVKIGKMTDNRSVGADSNFAQASTELAKIFNKTKYQGKTNWNVSSVEAWRKANNLTWHEMNNMQYMQLVPTEVNATFRHLGGVGEYNAMIGNTGGVDYD